MSIANQKDQSHSAAARVFKAVVEAGWHIYTSNWTTYDAFSHMKEREKGGGLSAALKLRDLASDSDLITVLPVTRTVEAEAVELFWRMQDKAWSCTTCANIILTRQLRIRLVFSGNHHYQQAGLTPLYS